jgi:hypothetical protein
VEIFDHLHGTRGESEAQYRYE